MKAFHLAAIIGAGLMLAPFHAGHGQPEERRTLYYQAPMGPERSPVPKKDDMGMDYLPVYEEALKPLAPASSRRVLFYRAPMSADTSPVPKKDQMGMDYVPVYEDEGAADGTVAISAERVQVLGVRTEAARTQVLVTPIRMVGTIAADERRLAVVAPRFEGWIQELIANTTGQPVRRGEPLFTFYSPEAAAAEREYLVARQVSGALAEAAMAKLRNLGLPPDRIAQLGRGGKAADVLAYPAPIDGIVMDKAVLAGQRFAAGETLYRISDLSNVWVLADVFEQDLASVRIGEPATVRLTAYPSRTFVGAVSFVYPTLNPTTRTARVRIELANPDLLLKPDMYATVAIDAEAAGKQVLTVPESALLDDGTRQIVLVERGPGRYQPRVVTPGRRGGGDVEITSGLAGTERVVVAANFLIDSESNLRSALQNFAAPETGHAVKQP
ncbi:MAG TPA: efflux RND transporter periplasmic adaptor subunit [Acetobacteraceae bacterium]|jgi:Cu(I)/Ag(I) efflux system membrane fusion protein|nr:efflux RND transporter periplasmic adaptor subunit [Acetobacteraceae bacterium]